jgi:hypothetical protein
MVALGLAVTHSALCAESAALAKLQGKWSAKRASDSGQETTLVLDIRGGTFTFKLMRADDEVRFFAKGAIRAESLGPFNVIKITDVQAGRSESDTEAVNDERTSVYVLGDDILTLASNFDKERENQKPTLDIYKRIAAAKDSAADKLAGKWKLVVKLGEDDRDYDLIISNTDGRFAGTLISPRSGEHKFKTITFADGKLAMELVRDIQGNEATFLYNGELKGSELSGTVTIKGAEDQFKGTWKAGK